MIINGIQVTKLDNVSAQVVITDNSIKPKFVNFNIGNSDINNILSIEQEAIKPPLLFLVMVINIQADTPIEYMTFIDPVINYYDAYYTTLNINYNKNDLNTVFEIAVILAAQQEVSYNNTSYLKIISVDDVTSSIDFPYEIKTIFHNNEKIDNETELGLIYTMTETPDVLIKVYNSKVTFSNGMTIVLNITPLE